MPLDREWRKRPRRPPSRIGEVVRSAREALGLTQYELAARIIINDRPIMASYISKIENGHVKQPNVLVMNGLSGALQLDRGTLDQAVGVETPAGDVELPLDVRNFAAWLATLSESDRARLIRVARAAHDAA